MLLFIIIYCIADTGARIQNTTVSIGTQTLQDIDLNEDDELEESSFTDEDRPNVTYRHVGTQMESSNVHGNSTFRHGTSRSFRSDRSSTSLHNPPAKVMYKDAGTSSQQSGSKRKSSQIKASKSRGDSYHSTLAYSSGHENQASESLAMNDRGRVSGDDENDLPHDETGQHDMQSTFRDTGYKSQSTRASHSESTSNKVWITADQSQTLIVNSSHIVSGF